MAAAEVNYFARLCFNKAMVLVSEPKRRVPLHHKKRVGQHHKSGKQYNKTYWPYLPLFLIAGAGLLLSNAWARQSKGVLGYATSVSPVTLLQDTNIQRGNDHEIPLRLNAALAQAAQTKAQDMTAHNYWSHTSPDGEQAWQFIAGAGYSYAVAGENLAYGFGSSDAVAAAWMHSAEHRANILNMSYQDVGFGIANSANFQGHGPQTVVVAMYGAPAPAAATSHAVLGAHGAQSVARVQLFGIGQNPWVFGLSAALAGAAVGIFIVRHGLLWRRVLVKSEAFVVHNHLFDVVLIVVGVVGFVITRSAGVIH